ncbi:MAG: TM1802 family CRISPR-associated protein, partial [bacterium]
QAAAFVVSDSINDVYYKHLKDIFIKLQDINMKTFSFKGFARRYELKFNDLYWLLFPNYRSHKKPDSRLYRKEMLNLFNSILKNREVDYKYLLEQFNYILRKRYFKNKRNVEEIITHPLKMNVLLAWLNKITDIRGGFKMSEGKSLTKIDDSDIREFFEVHSDIYKNNSYRQGLFLLGILMNQVLKEQQKEKKSANILDKLSFDGMPVRRVEKFVKDITEILNIYDKYSVNQLLHSQMIDRIQGIKNSNLNKDEVVFYILSGISFGRYLGHKYSKNKGEEN